MVESRERLRGRGSWRAGLLAALSVVLGVALAGCKAAFWSPDGRSIALDVDGRLQVFDVAAGKLTLLDTGNRKIVNPTYSPDGKHLAYYGITLKGEELDQVDLWVRDLATHRERKLAADVLPGESLGSPVPTAPGGQRPGQDPAGAAALIIKMGIGPSWSSDGRKLAHVRTLADKSGRVEIVDFATGGVTLPPLRGDSQLHPTWSPDGKRFAYLALGKNAGGSGGQDTPVDLYVADPEGKNSRRIWESAREPKIFPFGGLQWATDNARLTVTAMPSKQNDLSALFAAQAYAVPMAGGAPQLIGKFPAFAGSVAPSLRSIAYLGRNEDSTVVYNPWPFKKPQVLDRLPKAAKPFPDQAQPRLQPEIGAFPNLAYSPDEKRLALVFDEPVSNRQELRLYELPSGKRTVYLLKDGQAILQKVAPLAAPPKAPASAARPKPPAKATKKPAAPRKPSAGAGKAKPAAAPAVPEVLAALTTGWRTDLSVKNRPAGEVLRSLAAALKLQYRPGEDVQAALARPISLVLKGRSRLEGITQAAAKVGLYPIFNDEAVGFRRGPRPWPGASAGPFYAQVEGVEQYPEAAVGLVKVRVFGFGLSPASVQALETYSAAFKPSAVTGTQGQDLYDASWERPSFTRNERVFEQELEIPLKNLLRGVGAVRTLDLTAALTLPARVASVKFTRLAPGATHQVGGGQITFKKVEGAAEKTLHFETRRLPGKAELIALDARGKPLVSFGSGSFSFGDQGGQNITVRGKPASVLARVTLATKDLSFRLPLGGIVLDAERLPARILPARFPANRGPVTLQFLGITGSPDFPKLRVRATNHSDKSIRRIALKADYRDADGKSLEVKPHTQDAERSFGRRELPVLVPKGQASEFEVVAFFMPKATRNVGLTVESVQFSDTTEWKREQ